MEKKERVASKAFRIYRPLIIFSRDQNVKKLRTGKRSNRLKKQNSEGDSQSNRWARQSSRGFTDSTFLQRALSFCWRSRLGKNPACKNSSKDTQP